MRRPVGDYWLAMSRRGWLMFLGFIVALLLVFGGGAALRLWRWMFN